MLNVFFFFVFHPTLTWLRVKRVPTLVLFQVTWVVRTVKLMSLKPLYTPYIISDEPFWAWYAPEHGDEPQVPRDGDQGQLSNLAYQVPSSSAPIIDG